MCFVYGINEVMTANIIILIYICSREIEAASKIETMSEFLSKNEQQQSSRLGHSFPG